MNGEFPKSASACSKSEDAMHCLHSSGGVITDITTYAVIQQEVKCCWCGRVFTQLANGRIIAHGSFLTATSL